MERKYASSDERYEALLYAQQERLALVKRLLAEMKAKRTALYAKEFTYNEHYFYIDDRIYPM